MPSVFTLELEGEVLEASHDKQEIIKAGKKIAQDAILRPPIRVGSALIIGLNRGGHLSWELVEKSGEPVMLAVNKLAEGEDISDLLEDLNEE